MCQPPVPPDVQLGALTGIGLGSGMGAGGVAILCAMPSNEPPEDGGTIWEATIGRTGAV